MEDASAFNGARQQQQQQQPSYNPHKRQVWSNLLTNKDDLALSTQQNSGSFANNHANQDIEDVQLMPVSTRMMNPAMIFEEGDETSQILQTYPKTSARMEETLQNQRKVHDSTNPKLVEMSRAAH